MQIQKCNNQPTFGAVYVRLPKNVCNNLLPETGRQFSDLIHPLNQEEGITTWKNLHIGVGQHFVKLFDEITRKTAIRFISSQTEEINFLAKLKSLFPHIDLDFDMVKNDNQAKRAKADSALEKWVLSGD